MNTQVTVSFMQLNVWIFITEDDFGGAEMTLLNIGCTRIFTHFDTQILNAAE